MEYHIPRNDPPHVFRKEERREDKYHWQEDICQNSMTSSSVPDFMEISSNDVAYTDSYTQDVGIEEEERYMKKKEPYVSLPFSIVSSHPFTPTTYDYIKHILPKEIPVSILQRTHIHVILCFVRINHDCMFPFLEFALQCPMDTIPSMMKFYHYKYGQNSISNVSKATLIETQDTTTSESKKQSPDMISKNSTLPTSRMFLQEICHWIHHKMPKEFHIYSNADDKNDSYPDNYLGYLSSLEKEEKGKGDMDLFSSLLLPNLPGFMSDTQTSEDIVLVFQVQTSTKEQLHKEMLTLEFPKNKALEPNTQESLPMIKTTSFPCHHIQWYILDEIMYEYKHTHIDISVVNLFRQYPILTYLCKKDSTEGKPYELIGGMFDPSNEFSDFKEKSKEGMGEGGMEEDNVQRKSEAPEQNVCSFHDRIEWPQLLYMCRKESKEDTLYYHVLTNTSFIDLPIQHTWFGEGYLFTDSVVLASTPNPCSLQRYAVFTTIHDRYILRDIKQQTNEQINTFVHKYKDANVLTIFFRENGLRFWHVKSSDHFTRIS
jgi:hypothetical protein